MVGKAQKSHGARSELFGLEKVGGWNAIKIFVLQSVSRSMRCLGFSNYEKEAPRSKLPVPLSSRSLR
jgi:hypothetical protein